MRGTLLRRRLLMAALHQTPLARGSLGIGGRTMSSIAEPSFWKGLIPKPLRSSARGSKLGNKPKSKEWNPATFFIVIFLFIGSMSIQMIALKKDFATFTRQSDVRIGLLREVVEKLQRGEKVDVEKVLGTGDPERELEWEEVLKEIERGETAMKQRKKQPESPQAPSYGSTAPPAQETARLEAQSTLASKGFF